MIGTFLTVRHPRDARLYAALYQTPYSCAQYVRDERGEVRAYADPDRAELAAGRAFLHALRMAEKASPTRRSERRARRVFAVVERGR